METNTILTADYLDLVFDGRNKAYGSYELRRNYSRRVGQSLLVLAAIGLAITAYGLIGNRTVVLPEKPKAPPVVKYTPIDPIEPKITPPPVPALPPPPAKPTIVWTPPVIVPNEVAKPDDVPPEMKDFKDATAGPKTEVGDPNGADAPITGATSGSGSGNPVVETPPAPSKEGIPFSVEQMPQFNGDVQAWLASNVTYPEAAREGNIEGRVVVKFVVDEDGNVTQAQVERSVNSLLDAEALRAIRKMPRWIPGRQNGQAVKVWYRVPVKFALD